MKQLRTSLGIISFFTLLAAHVVLVLVLAIASLTHEVLVVEVHSGGVGSGNAGMTVGKP